MATPRTNRIVIVGGGTAGWMCAAALSRLLPSNASITLVESEQIGTVGVGEATIPHIRYFNQLLGIRECDFLSATGATYKLAIEFVGWGSENSRYMHPFSAHGPDIDGIDFHHHWLANRDGLTSLSLDDFSLAAQLARGHRMAPPPVHSEFGYGFAYHLDAGLYAAFLRRYAEARDVTRREGKVAQVLTSQQDGRIESLRLESGETLSGDLFIDCSGFRSLLLGQTLGVPFESWRRWLPCDRAVAMASDALADPPSFTRATATASGWRWRIPLQHRTGNGQVYASDALSDDEASDQLLDSLESAPAGEPRLIRFEAGRRTQSWEKNCVAVGLSGGFLEPLESTSIYLIQMAIVKLVEYFPESHDMALSRAAFNRWMGLEYERVRDFLILHYHLNRRTDSALWRECAAMTVPDSLREKMALFRESATVASYSQGLFAQPSWLAVYLGQGLRPAAFDPRVEQDPVLTERLGGLARRLKAAAQAAPHHGELLREGGLAREVPVTMGLYGGGHGG